MLGTHNEFPTAMEYAFFFPLLVSNHTCETYRKTVLWQIQTPKGHSSSSNKKNVETWKRSIQFSKSYFLWNLSYSKLNDLHLQRNVAKCSKIVCYTFQHTKWSVFSYYRLTDDLSRSKQKKAQDMLKTLLNWLYSLLEHPNAFSFQAASMHI
jgi:hypothetical protein